MDSRLTHRPLKRGLLAALAAAALLLPAVAAGPAAAVEGDGMGVVVVKVVDAAGKPVNGQVSLVEQGATGAGETSSRTAPGTYTFEVEAGRYGIFTITPWGGFTCAGISPCDYFALLGSGTGSSPVPSGAVTATDSETPTVYTVRLGPPASVTGTGTVGKPLTLTWSPQMASLVSFFGIYGGGIGAAPGVQWLRNGVAIPSAVSTTYTPTGADAGRVVSARVSYPVAGIWSTLEADSTPRLIAGRKVAKAASRTTVDVFRKRVVQGRSPGVRVDVTAGSLPAIGKVAIRIGKHTYRKTLRNGSARVPVPASLKPGRYRVVATYLGSSSYSASKGTGKFTVVRKG